MEISDKVMTLFNLLLEVMLYAAIPASVFIMITLLLYMWERFKKYKESEKKETEKILLGRAKQITEYDHQLERQEKTIKKNSDEIEIQEHRLKKLKSITKLDNEEETNSEEVEEILIDDMTIIELKDLAKKMGLKMYSKLNKEQLLEKLRAYV